MSAKKDINSMGRKQDCYNDLPLTYALDVTGKMVHVLSVERGLACNCRCPKCNMLLNARHGNGGHQPHFAHQGDNNCKGSYMSALHKLAEQIIEEEKAVMVPSYKEIDKQKLEFVKVVVERQLERKDLKPDIVGETSDGLRWFVEIRNTHAVDEAKRAKLIASNITCLEIDVRERTLEELKSFLLESIESREWINNPNYDLLIANEKRRKVSLVEKLLFDNQKFVVPDYGKYEMKKVHFDNVSVLFKSEDGLFVRVKANSTEGIPFIFNIGSQNVLNNRKPSLEVGQDYNELAINTDSVYSDTVIRSCFLDTKWVRHYLFEKEQEERIRRYKENPQYEIRSRIDCHSRCEYQPFYEECIYLKATFNQHGIDYVVCNKDKRQKDESGISLRNQEKCHILEEPLYENPLSENLPFERFWTIEMYYEQLLSSNSYETEKGLLADIVKHEKTSREIILLYKDPDDVRAYCTYHIVIVSFTHGDLKRNKVADFPNKTSAMQSFYERLNAMKSKEHLRQSKGNDNNDLPF